jgi:hypothetical protein
VDEPEVTTFCVSVGIGWLGVGKNGPSSDPVGAVGSFEKGKEVRRRRREWSKEDEGDVSERDVESHDGRAGARTQRKLARTRFGWEDLCR